MHGLKRRSASTKPEKSAVQFGRPQAFEVCKNSLRALQLENGTMNVVGSVSVKI